MLENIKALTFDTGGTILDWHHGLSRAFATAGARRGLQADLPDRNAHADPELRRRVRHNQKRRCIGYRRDAADGSFLHAQTDGLT